MSQENEETTMETFDAEVYDILDTSKWLPNAKLLNCDLCDQKFSNKLKIVIHWCTSHGYKLCSFCTNYAFKYDSDRIQHERQHIPFGCSICPYEFNKICEDSISGHYKKSHQSFLCMYCSSVIQPYTKYPEHVEKKHNVLNYPMFSEKTENFRLFKIENEDGEISQDSFFHCLMCDKKKRMNLLFGHYAFYHNISIHSLKKSLDLTPDICVSGSVLSSIEKDSSNDIEENGTGNNLKEKCIVCEHPMKVDEITKELHGVFCQGFVVCSQKDCEQIFETNNELSQHLDSEHSTTLSCKYGCLSMQLKPMEINDHMQSLHDIIECFLCNIVNSSGNFKNHLRDTHSVDLKTYEKAISQNASSSKLYRVEGSGVEKKQVLCNFCNHDITEEIKEFSFVNHYQNQHEIDLKAILRNLDRNPIIDVILNDKKSALNEECLRNFFIVKSFDSLIETDFDANFVSCIGTEHYEMKPKISDDDEEDDETNDDSQYTCEFCKKEFKAACGFYEHLRESHGFRLLNINTCDKCKTQIQCTETLTNQDNKNFNLSLVCPYDSSYHVTKDNFKNHMVFEHSDDALSIDAIIYKCHVCSYTYKNLKDIREHFNSFHPNIKMKYCRICRIKLPMDESSDHFALNHAEDLKRIERFCCKICKKEFKKENTAKLHYVRTHKKKELKKKSAFKCQNSLCNETFDNREDRKMHQIYAHPDEKMFECKACPLRFATKSSLSSHNMIHKNVVNTCEFCQKQFLRRDSFKEHLLIHSDVRLKCSFCEKVFVQRSNLVRHERIHLNDKPYKCSFCQKAFSDKGACTSHEKVHTKSEICTCEVCGKNFARKQKLKYHMRLHTLENVLTCECGKVFPESYSYRKHRETHQNKSVIKCKVCNKIFKSKKTKEKHERNEHGDDSDLIETKIQCTLCDLKDFTPDTIKEHLVTIHNIESANDWEKYVNEVEFDMDINMADTLEVNAP